MIWTKGVTAVKIVTFNLRVRWDNDGINSFIHRVGLIYEKISEQQPDIVAFQEVKPRHLELLEKLMPEYLFVGHGGSESYGGEQVCTAVCRSACLLCGFEVFWLGPEPHVPGSRFEGQSKHPRTCLFAHIRHRESGRMLRVYNTHLDHQSSQAALRGMECVLKRIGEDAARVGDVVLLGDFNEVPDGAALARCKAHQSPRLLDMSEYIPYTYHGFGTKDAFLKIDYIFASEGLLDSVRRVETWEDQKNGIYLSDHYPICAVLDI